MTRRDASCTGSEGTTAEPFWRRKRLDEMTEAEWESLCDGCARCCLVKLEDVDSGDVEYTRVACELLDQRRCRCTRYRDRHRLVADCVQLGPQEAARFRWLPATCAYRILAEGGDLPAWHPLVTGDPESVHRAGVSVRGRVVSAAHVHPEGLEEHVIRWVER